MMLLCFAYATTIGPILNFKSIVSSIVFHSSYTTTIQLRGRQYNCEADNVRNRRPSIYISLLLSPDLFSLSFFIPQTFARPFISRNNHSNTTTATPPPQQHHHNNTNTKDNTGEKNKDNNDNNDKNDHPVHARDERA